jgi:hypothetical protein
MRSIGLFVVVVALAACSGCARTSVSGKAVSEPTSKIQVLALIFDNTGSFSPDKPAAGPVARSDADIAVKKAYENQRLLAINVHSQFPPVFRANGIELSVYMRSTDQEQFRREAAGRRHVMHLTPTRATYRSYGGNTTLTMRAQLNELRPLRTIWTGSVSVTRLGLGFTIDEKFAAEFAEKILEQLNEDKIIELPGGKVKR